MKNQDYVATNLKEALSSLQNAIEAIEEGNGARFEAQIAFAYRKMNLAFNSLNVPMDRLKGESDAEFEERCKFPLPFEQNIAGL